MSFSNLFAYARRNPNGLHDFEQVRLNIVELCRRERLDIIHYARRSDGHIRLE